MSILLCLNDPPYSSQLEAWARIDRISGVFDGFRCGFPGSVLEGKSIDKLGSKSSTLWYQHEGGDIATISRRVQKAKPGATEILVNEPRLWSLQLPLSAFDAELKTKAAIVKNCIHGTAHGYFTEHDKGETYEWQRELDRSRARWDRLRLNHPDLKIAGNYYVAFKKGIVHPLEQLRLKLFHTPYCAGTEWGIYQLDPVDDYDLGLWLGLGMKMIEEALGTATLYASGPIASDAPKNFGLFAPDGSLRERRFAGFCAGLG